MDRVRNAAYAAEEEHDVAAHVQDARPPERRVRKDIEPLLGIGLSGEGCNEPAHLCLLQGVSGKLDAHGGENNLNEPGACLLYTSDAADDLLCVDIGGRRIIKKKKI